MSSTELLYRVQQKDSLAERVLFEWLSPKLFALCRRYSHDDSQAKDYFQDCFIHVFSKIHLFDATIPIRFENWVLKICRNLILSKKRKKVREISLEYREVLPEKYVQEGLGKQIISEAEMIGLVESLPDNYKNVLQLRIFEDYSHCEIANTLGISVCASRTQFKRAKKLLRKIIAARQTSQKAQDCHSRVEN